VQPIRASDSTAATAANVVLLPRATWIRPSSVGQESQPE
jgi:hypothetical protein